MQISLLESLDKKYNLCLYLQDFGDLKNAVAGSTSNLPITSNLIKLFYPQFGMYIKTKLHSSSTTKSCNKVEFLDFTTANISPDNFPSYVKANYKK